MSLEVGFDHHLRELAEGHLRLPTNPRTRLRRIGNKKIYLGRPEVARVLNDVFAIVQANALERDLAELSNGPGEPSAHDIIIGLRLLEHAPHCFDVVPGEAPVAP